MLNFAQMQNQLQVRLHRHKPDAFLAAARNEAKQVDQRERILRFVVASL